MNKYHDFREEEDRFGDFKQSVKALKSASGRRDRMRVIYGDQVIQID